MRLTLFIPVYNEEENIENLIRQIEGKIKIDHDLMVVNDHSTDKTAEIVKSLFPVYPNLTLIENTLPNGFANAIRMGLKSCNTEVVAPIMGDLCDDLSTIDSMYKKIQAGFDVVCASRYIKDGKRLGGSKLKAFLSSLGGKTIHFLLGIPTHDIANAFKMYRKNAVDAIRTESKGFEISMELPLKAYFAGYKITEVPTVWKERTKGKSNFKIFKLLPNYLKLYIWAVFMKLKGK